MTLPMPARNAKVRMTADPQIWSDVTAAGIAGEASFSSSLDAPEAASVPFVVVRLLSAGVSLPTAVDDAA